MSEHSEDSQKTVPLPPAIWEVLRARHAAAETEAPIGQSRQWHLAVSLRLKDGTIKRWVEINQRGEAFAELYEEFHVKAEHYGPPRFETSDVHSWGNMKSRWRPTWRDWCRHVGNWVVVAYADDDATRVVPQ